MMKTAPPSCIDTAYRLLESVNPLRWDCGRLCGSICCSERAPGKGMVLLPGEELRYQPAPDWAEVVELDALPPEQVPPRYRGFGLHLLICRGRCRREERPLACRVFPLAPILTARDVVRLVLDTDGIEICPLVQYGKLSALDRAFVGRVRAAWQVLLEDPAIRRWIQAESHRRILGEHDPWLKLFADKA